MRKVIIPFFKKREIKQSILLFSLFILLSSCTLENLTEDSNQIPKTDYSSFNYVLATEDSYTPDITRFFTFNFSDINRQKKYDLISENKLFINSDPSTSSGYQFFDKYIFSLAKDKKGYSSTPGIYRLTLNNENRVIIDKELNINKDNLFPSRKLCIVNKQLGFYYNEGLAAQTIQAFDPTSMRTIAKVDLKPFIKQFRPQAKFTDEYGNNLIRTGSLVLDHKEGKLYVSIVFLEKASFNLISEQENNFYLAVIDIDSLSFEKIISYPKAKTVSFFVSENHSTTKDEQGNIYFGSWGWNQFYAHNPSRVFRINKSETDFDLTWDIDIEKQFGPGRIAQSIISYNNKVYLHISKSVYQFDSSEDSTTKNSLQMGYYEVDPQTPDVFKELDIPYSNPSSRMNVFTIVDDKLFICVPNSAALKFNGVYALDRKGHVQPVLQIANKYKPTRFYKLGE
ncbi:hypothetical protein [Myroides odoratimimus]|uniref:hypothetical protein n=1 Tax=Myroides odoratimimus TaxID=76832 RepID=UPI001CE19472|nr:hypothetical protein [Myroides odoratimimus]MCA4807012.1 hypothetical protein [Myroides odoratimimus]